MVSAKKEDTDAFSGKRSDVKIMKKDTVNIRAYIQNVPKISEAG